MSTQLTYKGTQTIHVGPKDEQIEFTVDFEVEAEMSFTPGVTWGPPENCYPDEGECELGTPTLLAVYDVEGNPVAVHPEAAGRLLAAIDWDKVEEACWEQYHKDSHGARDE